MSGKRKLKTLSFLDLPGEIRNQIYTRLLPTDRMIKYHPQLFKDAFPKEVYVNPVRTEHMLETVEEYKTILNLTHANQQIRLELRNMLYGRHIEWRKRYHFDFRKRYPCCQKGDNFYPCDRERHTFPRLSKRERVAGQDLMYKGIPLAVLRTMSWQGFYDYELLVPDWRDGLIKWRRFSDAGRHDAGMEDEIVAALRNSKERIRMLKYCPTG